MPVIPWSRDEQYAAWMRIVKSYGEVSCWKASQALVTIRNNTGFVSAVGISSISVSDKNMNAMEDVLKDLRRRLLEIIAVIEV